MIYFTHFLNLENLYWKKFEFRCFSPLKQMVFIKMYQNMFS
uniref:Uncharacterized protein n=1 Tax=Anguilla anguilla TaxID=7936 RepID=A0A0E9VBK0_ANGAN